VTSEAPSNKPRFTVLSQKPEGGSKIKRGSEITLTLAAGG
jgi:beta-lactam-binding protein with PASTA domain